MKIDECIEKGLEETESGFKKVNWYDILEAMKEAFGYYDNKTINRTSKETRIQD